jgi:hypothetical protein
MECILLQNMYMETRFALKNGNERCFAFFDSALLVSTSELTAIKEKKRN